MFNNCQAMQRILKEHQGNHLWEKQSASLNI